MSVGRPGTPRSALRLLGLVAIALVVACAGGSSESADGEGAARPVGSPDRGRQLIAAYGCGACHYVPGVPGARGRVAPPLTAFAERRYIAGGGIPNTPERLIEWIHDPRALKPGTAMPVVGVSRAEAADMAAYLYTLD